MKGEPRSLITGAGRSGTRWLAHVLQTSGLHAGHEGWWNLDKHDHIEYLDVDVSWLGCFDDGFQGAVYTQVRDPLVSIPSIWATNRMPWSLLRRVSVPHTGNEFIDAAQIWLAYNEHALERSREWWQVETITAARLSSIFGKAIWTGPADPNLKSLQVGRYCWPDHPIIDQCLALAADLGYEGADPREEPDGDRGPIHPTEPMVSSP